MNTQFHRQAQGIAIIHQWVPQHLALLNAQQKTLFSDPRVPGNAWPRVCPVDEFIVGSPGRQFQ
ncbi:hypothetical protein BHU25_16305 [Pseudomonas vranovensis]|uniref:Uncharacterized protein n=1 Tax=Pseudomonas vranovensis TaxID=321661 RepID=A0A423DGI6_9PSED|nr:hypothetical protein BHU25_16305 [Pseudomonas vranovensis]